MPKGVRIGGRAKGTPNKATADVRAAIAVFASANVHRMDGWLRSIDDPAKAMELYLRAIEYHIPKLGRLEHTGKDGETIPVSFVMNLHPTGDGK